MLIYLDTKNALAYWAMDEGAWTKSGFIYIQKDLQFLETSRLVAILHYRITLDCSVQDPEGKPVISIKAKSMKLFVVFVFVVFSLVHPHFHKSMMYKLIKTTYKICPL